MGINNFTLTIGGEAGYGIMNTGLAFAKFCTRNCLFAFLSHEYPSLVRGGHNTSSVRVSEKEVGSHSKKISVLVALNRETIDLHISEMEKDGIIIFDPDEIKDYSPGRKDIHLVPVPFVSISKKICNNRLLSNSVSLGAAVALIKGELKIMKDVVSEMYAGKGKEIVEWNSKALDEGYKTVLGKGNGIAEIKKLKGKKKYILSGNEALGLGAIAAGCKFISQYPMTPTSQLLSFMASHSKSHDILVLQPEDEISSIHLAMGAANSGVRAMTATSGGGFALMSEGFGLAGIAEIPVVVVSGQRGAPATGLPTRHEQGDLLFVLNSGQGDIVRIVIAPSDVEDAFHSAAEAFNLAEKFQVPVILLPDKYLCVNAKATEGLSSKDIKVDRGLMVSDKELAKAVDFKRYDFDTETGVSPRSIPGQKNGLFNAASDEHDEHGQLIEDPETRNRIMEKRMKKIPFIKQALPSPELDGDKGADITLIGWGSTKHAIREAMGEIREFANLSVNHLHIKYMAPFQSEAIAEILKSCKRTIVIEDNYSSQLSQLIRQKTGIEIKEKVLRYDGKQFSADEIYKRVMEVLNGRAK